MSKLLVPFFTAGFPELNSTENVLKILQDNGADYVEVGLPHSDPLADGDTIQYSSGIAVKNGMNIDILSEQVRKFKEKIKEKESNKEKSAKLILFSYYNPVLAYGLERVVKLWKDVGGSCLLVPDLPVEESGELLKLCKENGLKLIFLVAPTTSDERIDKIVDLSDEFIYLVSVKGVTGVRAEEHLASGNEVTERIRQIIRKIKNTKPSLKVVLGFGIGNISQAKNALCTGADGVVIGSAIINILKSKDYNSELASFIRSFNELKE